MDYEAQRENIFRQEVRVGYSMFCDRLWRELDANVIPAMLSMAPEEKHIDAALKVAIDRVWDEQTVRYFRHQLDQL